jgi:hypothetical protein
MCGCGRKLKIQLQQHQMQKRLQVRNLSGGQIMRKPAIVQPQQQKPVDVVLNQRFQLQRHINSFRRLNGRLPGSNKLKNRPI